MPPIANNTTAVLQVYKKYTTIYHKSTTKVLHNYTKMGHSTPKSFFNTNCNTLPHSVAFFRNNHITNCIILLQNITFPRTIVYYTINCNILI